MATTQCGDDKRCRRREAIAIGHCACLFEPIVERWKVFPT
jgi:hypothetical protein